MSVRLEEISFCYGEKKILDKISLTVREKEHIGILGGSGSGKSTLLKILAGLYTVKDGHCMVANETLPEQIRKQVAMVMQMPGLFHCPFGTTLPADTRLRRNESGMRCVLPNWKSG